MFQCSELFRFSKVHSCSSIVQFVIQKYTVFYTYSGLLFFIHSGIYNYLHSLYRYFVGYNEHFISFQTFKSHNFKEKIGETMFEELSFNDREILFSFNIAVKWQLICNINRGLCNLIAWGEYWLKRSKILDLGHRFIF